MIPDAQRPRRGGGAFAVDGLHLGAPAEQPARIVRTEHDRHLQQARAAHRNPDRENESGPPCERTAAFAIRARALFREDRIRTRP